MECRFLGMGALEGLLRHNRGSLSGHVQEQVVEVSGPDRQAVPGRHAIHGQCPVFDLEGVHPSASTRGPRRGGTPCAHQRQQSYS